MSSFPWILNCADLSSIGFSRCPARAHVHGFLPSTRAVFISSLRSNIGSLALKKDAADHADRDARSVATGHALFLMHFLSIL